MRLRYQTSAKLTNLSARFALMCVGGERIGGKRWKAYVFSVCRVMVGGTESRGTDPPGRRLADRRVGRAGHRLGRPVWHLADRVPLSRACLVRAQVDRSSWRFPVERQCL